MPIAYMNGREIGFKITEKYFWPEGEKYSSKLKCKFAFIICWMYLSSHIISGEKIVENFQLSMYGKDTRSLLQKLLICQKTKPNDP